MAILNINNTIIDDGYEHCPPLNIEKYLTEKKRYLKKRKEELIEKNNARLRALREKKIIDIESEL